METDVHSSVRPDLGLDADRTEIEGKRAVGNHLPLPDCASPRDGGVNAGPLATSLWYVAPGHADLRTAPLGERGDKLRVRVAWSALSRGTERLVASGRVPESERERMRAPIQDGDFPFPVKYGYCAVGRVEAGPQDWHGRHVFCLAPHQDVVDVPVSFAARLPQGVPARRAILAANMETALNGIWDSAAGPGDRVVVVGAGIVGMLVAVLAARLPGAEVTIVDVDPARRPLAEAMNVRFASPGEALGDADVVFHCSATPAGLANAIASAGNEAVIVEMSWYGEGTIPVPLGGAFHSRRLRLVSSQVGQVSPGRRPRWTHQRRLDAAIRLLDDERLDAMITEEVAFGDLPGAIPRILADGAPGLVTAVRYPGA
jgi:NADPH:quinone reductase-like Zn-dependent oxidoreductase